jgi:hypothetical protein
MNKKESHAKFVIENTFRFVFYYKYNMWKKPVVCVCLLVSPQHPFKVITRGISICNDKDNCSKKIGRLIAKGRAVKAFVNTDNSEKTYGGNPKVFLLRSDQYEDETRAFNFKSEFKPYLSSYEENLIKKVFKLEEKVNE